MKKIIVLLISIAVIVLSFLLAIQSSRTENHEQEKRGRSGAMEALEFWSHSRAYPGNDIPSDKYYKAFQYHNRYFTQKEHKIFSNYIWEPIGPMNLQGRSKSVALNPMNPTTVYLGSASGGLWRSYSGGLSADWEQIRLGYPALGISAIVIDPSDSNVIYLGTGEVYKYGSSIGGVTIRTTRGSYGIGILKTTDGGETWTKSLDWSYNQQRGIQKIEMNPLNNKTLYAATTEGLYKSMDAGDTWEQQLDVLMAEDIVIHTNDTNKLLVSCGNFDTPGRGIYRTTDGGMTWTNLPSVPAYSGKTMLAKYESDPEIVFASIADSTTRVGALYKTTDFGTTWQYVNSAVNYGVQGWYSHFVAVHPTNLSWIIHGGVNIVKSTDGGANFYSSFGSYADHHSYAYSSSNPSLIYVVNDDGIYRSTDFGDNFASVGYGLLTGQLYAGFSNSSTSSRIALGQSQDHIPGYLYTGSLDWQSSAADEVGWTAINPANDFIMYAGRRWGEGIYKSTDRGNSFFWLYGFSGGGWNSPFVISPANPSILYFGTYSVYKTSDAGSTWFTTGNVSDGNPSLSMAISATDPNIVYVGKSPIGTSARIYRTTDGGISWTNITGTLPDRYPMDIAVDPTNSNIVYVAYGGFGTGHFFKSTDAGTSWTDITGALPDAPTTAIAVDPFNTNYVYVGNDIGVYLTTDAGTTWFSFSDGFPDAVIVADLTVSPSNRALRAATHGNGVWERSLYDGTSPFAFDYRAYALVDPAAGTEYLIGSQVDNPRASFKNSGIQAQTDSFEVKYRILDGDNELFSATKRLNGLDRNEVKIVMFDGSLALNTIGTYAVEAIVRASDQNSTNDTLRGTIVVIIPPTITQANVEKLYHPYTEISDGIPGPTGDDEQISLSLPFLFLYDGYVYDKVQISTNGWIELGEGDDGTEQGLSTAEQIGCCGANENGRMFRTERPTKALGIWWEDLNTYTAGDSTASVTYTTQDAAEGRVFIVQWKNMLAYYDPASTNTRINFQARLYETTNMIEYCYGEVQEGRFSGMDAGAMIGMKDHLGGNFHFYDFALGRAGRISEGMTNLSPLTNWPGTDSCYRIGSGKTAVEENSLQMDYASLQIYPNPFNPKTNIRYALPHNNNVRLVVYDITGREVAVLINGYHEAGFKTVTFDASALSSGMYLCRLTAGKYTIVRKMIVIK
jgi:photosystem II stability/assembly factor-like uncharacterized protein